MNNTPKLNATAEDFNTLDLEALDLALEHALAAPEDIKGRHEQIQWMIETRGKVEAGTFASYHMQIKRLGLKPWELPPCASDGVGRSPGARLRKRLERAGVSAYHPHPVKALKEFET